MNRSGQLKAKHAFKKAIKQGRVSTFKPNIFASSRPEALSKSTVSQASSSGSPQSVVNTCKECKKLPLGDQCITTILVTERDTQGLEGCALTCAPPNDCLPPLKGSKSKKTTFTGVYYTPEELGLHKISHRPHVYQRCGRDTVLLLNAGNPSDLVGAIHFKAIPSKTLGRMMEHHRQVSRLPALGRGCSFDAWRYGVMRAIGSRVPQGGRPGDAYAFYKGMDGGTDQEIKALFGHAQDFLQ
ncbi:hypothetical protein C0992_000199 [Termitomyces sp. T32_za158]|nr:hypothetical protein C0992_000199 [Termitomyces sp. T32_za158]